MLSTFLVRHSDDIIPKNYIVLDLDSTLVHTFDTPELLAQYAESVKKTPSITNSTYKIAKDGELIVGVRRPFVREFLSFCDVNFEGVCVWSAGAKYYVEEIVRDLFDGHNIKKPILVYSRPDCVVDKDGYYFKPLTKMIKEPILKGKMTLENTVFVDDNITTLKKNMDNGILIPPYKINSAKLKDVDAGDPALYLLIWYFLSDEFRETTDVRDIEKPSLKLETI